MSRRIFRFRTLHAIVGFLHQQSPNPALIFKNVRDIEFFDACRWLVPSMCAGFVGEENQQGHGNYCIRF